MMKNAIVMFLFLCAGVFGNPPIPGLQMDTSLNISEFSGKIGVVTCPKPADVTAMQGRSCRTKSNVTKEIMSEINKCKYLLDSKKDVSLFKGTVNISFQVTSDGYIANYKVIKTDVKRKSILKDIENQIRATQFGKAQGRDCVSEITCNFKLKVLTLKNAPKQ
jgi:hypothetical protein